MKRRTGPGDHPPPTHLPESREEPEPGLDVEAMHRDMNEWRSEHDAWLDDIDAWQREHKLAELVLYKLDRALPNHNSALAEHADAIKQHKKHVSRYERSLKNYIGSGKQDSLRYQALMKEHREQEARHQSERQRHKSFRDMHHAVMAELLRIRKLIDKDEES